MTPKHIHPDQELPLNLSIAERKLILEEVACIDPDYSALVNETPNNEPLMLTLADLDDFGGYIAAEANHCADRKKQKQLDAVFEKVQELLDSHTDEEEPRTINFEAARQEKMILDHSVQVAEIAAGALVAAERLRIKTKQVQGFYLAPAQRDVLLAASILSKPRRNKVAKGKTNFSVADVASMTLELIEDLADTDPSCQTARLLIADHLLGFLRREIDVGGNKASTNKSKRRKIGLVTAEVFQLKITLRESDPAIWRRIQIANCTLDKLHAHIQTAMGWTNSRLHHFEIGGERHGDPELLDDGFEDFECVDSTVTRISDILPNDGKRFRFLYVYDFGDDWKHEVLFEGCLKAEKGGHYPVCVEGERACPPEDVGGVWGYAEFLEAIADPNHEQHDDFADWAGNYDPQEFDAGKISNLMQHGLPDWKT